MSKKTLKVMNAEHVTAEIGIDDPKAGQHIKVNGQNYTIVKDKVHGLVVQLDTSYEPHRKLAASHKGWLFSHWGLVTVIVVAIGFILYHLAA